MRFVLQSYGHKCKSGCQAQWRKPFDGIFAIILHMVSGFLVIRLDNCGKYDFPTISRPMGAYSLLDIQMGRLFPFGEGLMVIWGVYIIKNLNSLENSQ